MRRATKGADARGAAPNAARARRAFRGSHLGAARRGDGTCGRGPAGARFSGCAAVRARPEGARPQRQLACAGRAGAWGRDCAAACGSGLGRSGARRVASGVARRVPARAERDGVCRGLAAGAARAPPRGDPILCMHGTYGFMAYGVRRAPRGEGRGETRGRRGETARIDFVCEVESRCMGCVKSHTLLRYTASRSCVLCT